MVDLDLVAIPGLDLYRPVNIAQFNLAVGGNRVALMKLFRLRPLPIGGTSLQRERQNGS
jgi:hypothetical protein